jgi:drug/metabolite transporter (DMT)-like permease
MIWFYLALLCAFSLALADAYSKKYFSAASSYSVLIARLCIPGVLLLPFTVYFALPQIPVEVWRYMLLLMPLEVFAMWLYIRAIQIAPLHLTLPYLAFTPMFNILTGYLLLDEVITWDGVLGILLIVVGTYILNIDSLTRSWRSLLRPLTAVFRIQGSRWMLLVATIYSLTSVLSKDAMSYTDPDIFGAFYYSFIGVFLLMLILLMKPAAVREVIGRPREYGLVGLFMAFMVVTHFIAIAQVEVAYMVAVKRTSLLFGMLLGAWMFRDMSFRQHLPAGIMMLVGVFFILL